MKVNHIYEVYDGEQLVMKAEAEEIAECLHVSKNQIYNACCRGAKVKGKRILKNDECQATLDTKTRGIPQKLLDEWDNVCGMLRCEMGV